MSRPRSRSPNHRRFPSGQRDFNPDRILSDLKHHDHFPDDPRFGPQRHPDQGRIPHCRPPPPLDAMYYDDRRPSPQRDGGYEVDRHRGEHFQRSGSRQRSPTWAPRDEFSFRGHHQRKPGMNWRREDQGRGRGGFRDSSPGMRPDDRSGGYRGRWTDQGPNRGRFRDGLHQERGPPLKRSRRETDEHPGYRDENSGNAARGGFGGGSRGGFPHGDHRRSSPRDVDHSRALSEWERLEACGPHGPRFDRQRSPRSQERFKGPHSRGEERGHHFDDNTGDPNYLDARKEPALQGGPENSRYGNRDRPFNHRGWGGARRMHDQRGGGRNDYHRNQPHLQHSRQDSAPKERPAHPPFRNEVPGPPEKEPGWAEGDRRQQWAPRSSEDLDPKILRQRMGRGWSERKDDGVAVQAEETLTIKVDMSRPLSQKSPLCYSSDRQLSLDLVNVGRQRLDFLPMLQHSGAHQESGVRMGTFAQEIISLVHLVKEQYFRGDGPTLSERFSAPQTADLSEEAEELTLNQRFSANRGFSSNLDSLLDDEEPLFCRLEPTQGLSKPPLRGPGDLRHDLERRRQEKLEGVKVTILGKSISQHSMGADSELDDAPQTEWAGHQRQRPEGDMGQRRGAPNRNAGPPRRNFRFPYQRHGGPTGPNW